MPPDLLDQTDQSELPPDIDLTQPVSAEPAPTSPAPTEKPNYTTFDQLKSFAPFKALSPHDKRVAVDLWIQRSPYATQLDAQGLQHVTNYFQSQFPDPPPYNAYSGDGVKIAGKISTFGGDADKAVWDKDLVVNGVRQGDPGTTASGKSTLGNPNALYAALPGYIQSQYGLKWGDPIQVTNPKTGKTVTVPLWDTGPGKSTSRIIDVSPTAMMSIGGNTDDVVHITLPNRKSKNPLKIQPAYNTEEQQGSPPLMPLQPSPAPAVPQAQSQTSAAEVAHQQALASIRQKFLQPGDQSAPAQLAEALSKDTKDPQLQALNQAQLKKMAPITQEAVLQRAQEFRDEANGTPHMYAPQTNKQPPSLPMRVANAAGNAVETLAAPIKLAQYQAEQALGPKPVLPGDVAEQQRLAAMNPYDRMMALRDEPLRNLGRPESEMYAQQREANSGPVEKGLSHVGGTLTEMAVNPTTYGIGALGPAAQAARTAGMTRLATALRTGEIAANTGFTAQMLAHAVQTAPDAAKDPIGFLFDSGMAVLGGLGLVHSIRSGSHGPIQPDTGLPDTVDSNGRTFSLKTDENGVAVRQANGQPIYEPAPIGKGSKVVPQRPVTKGVKAGAVQVESPAGGVPSPIGTGENIAEGGQGVRPSDEGTVQEVAGSRQAQAAPIEAAAQPEPQGVSPVQEPGAGKVQTEAPSVTTAPGENPLVATARRLASENVSGQSGFVLARDLYAEAKKAQPDLTREQFAQQLLDAHRDRPRGVEFETPTGKPKPGDVFTANTNDGRTVQYYGVSFPEGVSAPGEVLPAENSAEHQARVKQSQQEVAGLLLKRAQQLGDPDPDMLLQPYFQHAAEMTAEKYGLTLDEVAPGIQLARNAHANGVNEHYTSRVTDEQVAALESRATSPKPAESKPLESSPVSEPPNPHLDARFEQFRKDLDEHPDRTNPNKWVAGKSAWEVTRDVWVGLQPESYQAGRAEAHERLVRQALSEGKPVPPEVLKDYPDLAAKASQGEQEPLGAQTPPKEPVTPKINSQEAVEASGEPEHHSHFQPRDEEGHFDGPPENPESTTSARNEISNEERKSLGMDDLPEPERKARQVALDNAMEKGYHLPDRAQSIAENVIAGKENFGGKNGDELQAGLALRKLDLIAEHKDILNQVEATDDPAELARLKIEADRKEAQFDLISTALKRGGTDIARALSFRASDITPEYEVLPMRAQAKLKKVAPLTPKETERVDALATALKEAQEKIVEHQERTSTLENRVKELEAKKSIKQMESEAKSEKRTRRAQTREDLRKEFDSIADEIGRKSMKLSAGIDPELIPLLGRMAKNLVKQGIVEVSELVDRIHEAITEHLPDVTKRDVRDAISGYGVLKEGTQDPEEMKLQQMKRAMRLISQIEDVSEGTKPQASGYKPTPDEPEVAALRTQLSEALKAAGMREPFSMTEEQRQSAQQTRLKARIDELNRRIKENDYSKAGKRPGIPSTPELDKLKAERDRLQTQYDENKPQAITDAERLQRTKDALNKGIKDYTERIAKGDYEKRTRPEQVMDAEAIKLKTRREALKSQWQAELERLRPKGALERYAQLHREFILSGMSVFAKLGGASAWNLPVEALADTLGAGIGKATGLSKISEREGVFSPSAEITRVRGTFSREALNNARQSIMHGLNDIGALAGMQAHNELGGYMGRLHGAVKSLIETGEFKKALEIRLQQAAKHGIDITDSDVQMQTAVKAANDALSQILQGDNELASKMNAAMANFQHSKSVGLRVLGAVMRTLVPVTRVAANYAGKAARMTGAGLAEGGVRHIGAIAESRAEGKPIPPEVADKILQAYKYGGVGLVAAYIGLAQPDWFKSAGYFVPADKTQNRDAEGAPMDNDTIELFGAHMPRLLSHSPFVAAVQFWATMRRGLDSGNMGQALYGPAYGLAMEAPGLESARRMGQAAEGANKAGKVLGEYTKGLTIPQAVQQGAAYMDQQNGQPIQRKPQDFWETYQTGIPGLRENVPTMTPSQMQKMLNSFSR